MSWLKGAHLLFVCLWVGGALGVMVIQNGGGTDEALFGRDVAARLVDDFVVIPGAMGSLLTGLVYSLFTPWGFFRHRWVAVKWFITLYGVLFGTFFLGPWLNSLAPVSAKLGGGAMGDYAYMRARDLNSFWGGVQICTLLFALVISVLKPWRKAPPEKSAGI
jgi:hypothetical protein